MAADYALATSTRPLDIGATLPDGVVCATWQEEPDLWRAVLRPEPIDPDDLEARLTARLARFIDLREEA